MSEPLSFRELLELQEIHELEINKIEFRKKNLSDLRAALMDEFLEFRKELPAELNFKAWKKKTHSPEKQLEEFVDMLFFIATEINLINLKEDSADEWDYCWQHYNFANDVDNIFLNFFMRNICEDEILNILRKYIFMAKMFGYKEKDIFEQYKKKWQHNLKDRISGDWNNEMLEVN